MLHFGLYLTGRLPVSSVAKVLTRSVEPAVTLYYTTDDNTEVQQKESESRHRPSQAHDMRRHLLV